MKMKTAIAVFSVLIIVVPAMSQPPQPCCTPPQWEGNVAQSQGQNVAGQGHRAAQIMTLSMDANLKKVAHRGQWYYDQQQGTFQLLQDFKAGVQYQITNGGPCVKSKLTQPWMGCIPKTSKFMGSAVLGLGDDSIKVNNWAIFMNSSSLMGTSYTQVTAKDCVPIGSTFQGSAKGVGMMSVQGVTNVSAGIKDPSVFSLPASCQKAKEADEKDKDSSMDIRLF
ncbi:mammalian ependymin-related protein 1-like [Lingula anatina]|uniref:Mammalian ependymin-related protein 1-like n=1 Tax=Lingula anatina TaxID=7574 RepID=A0A1S3IP60_LINAN|nr:mammalian ependymin-related protein 1-like [Lingula anatina]|eukprot:XP_013399691.1 mammalian ependymin-related protein 1-like [Lingula anatina]